MGLLSGSLSLMPYAVTGATDKLRHAEWLAQRLSLLGFRPIDQGAEETAAGWTRLGHPDDSDFTAQHDFLRDDYLVFSLRIDRRRIPGALLRRRLEEVSREFLQSRPGLRRVPKAKREELREQVRLELLTRTLPVPASYDILWQRDTGRLLLLTLNRQAVETFESLFGRTFEGLQLHPQAPLDWVAARLPAELKPHLPQPREADGYLERVALGQWLGRDLLRWLFHATLTRGDGFSVRCPGPAVEGAGFSAYLNDRLVLAASDDSGTQKVTVAGPQTRFAETRTALAQGKEILEGTLYLERDQYQWRFAFKADRFLWGSLRLPVVRPDVDPAEDASLADAAEFFARTGAVEEALQLFDSLLLAFLKQRLDDGWPARDQAIRTWLEAGA